MPTAKSTAGMVQQVTYLQWPSVCSANTAKTKPEPFKLQLVSINDTDIVKNYSAINKLLINKILQVIGSPIKVKLHEKTNLYHY